MPDIGVWIALGATMAGFFYTLRELNKGRKKIHQVDDRQSESIKAVQVLQADLNHRDETIEHLSAQLSDLKKDFIRSEDQKGELLKQNSQRVDELIAETNRRNALEKENVLLKDSIARLEERIANTERRVNELEAERDKWQLKAIEYEKNVYIQQGKVEGAFAVLDHLGIKDALNELVKHIKESSNNGSDVQETTKRVPGDSGGSGPVH